ncbi:MAG TPA: transposase [Candidatus Cloacimonadota bacterium]|nr:transposase [Candidatus Cloacimonadota bacterium]
MAENESNQFKYWRRLPHIQPEDSYLFITFRINHSLPKSMQEKINSYQSDLEKKIAEGPNYRNIIQKKVYGLYDELLAKCNSPTINLTDIPFGNIIMKQIEIMNHDYIRLICSTIMPNHVHILFKPLKSENEEPYKMSDIMHMLKMKTAKEINFRLGRKGRFWQREYFDYCVRNDVEMQNIINYIMMNPVKAGLVKEPELWKWSWLRQDIEE